MVQVTGDAEGHGLGREQISPQSIGFRLAVDSLEDWKALIGVTPGLRRHEIQSNLLNPLPAMNFRKPVGQRRISRADASVVLRRPSGPMRRARAPQSLLDAMTPGYSRLDG